MSHLLLFSLGPVQDFIATARRCQDLWFGSRLLSDLAKSVAKAIEAHTGSSGSLVVPGDLMNVEAVANEIIAIVDDPRAVADVARKALDQRLEHHIATLFADIPDRYFMRDVAEAQVRGLIELTWAAAPLTAGYAKAREAAKALLGARKATRNWKSLTHEGPYPKSTLDGTRASVIREDAYPPKDPERFRRDYKAKPTERLSGVDLLKRVGEERDDAGKTNERPIFHSTSHISSGPLRQRLERYPGVFAAWRDRLMQHGIDVDRFRLRDDQHDGYLLYEDRLLELLTEYRPNSESKSIVECEPLLRRELKRLLEQTGLKRAPTAYYAVLLADGDKMGAFISKRCQTERDHQKFSIGLEKWARGCRERIEDLHGTCIYAGGDDVLALLPLHTALAAARELGTTFNVAMHNTAQLLTRNDDSPALPTLSVGLAIAHHMQPMRDALELAHRAEKKAKDAGRDALAIMLAKRGGGTLDAVAKWDAKLDERIPHWAELLGKEALPDKVAFAFEEAVAPFDPKAPPSEELLIALVTRTIHRRRSDRGDTKLDAELAAHLRQRLTDRTDDKTIIDNVQALSHELQIARLFHDAFDEANPRTEIQA